MPKSLKPFARKMARLFHNIFLLQYHFFGFFYTVCIILFTRHRDIYSKLGFLEQKYRIGYYEIKMPRFSKFIEYMEDQTLRELGLGILAYEFSKKYDRSKKVIDIGANIGVTAAIMSSFSKGSIRLHLIEPSPYYFHFLSNNAGLIPGVEKIDNSFIAWSKDSNEIKGALFHEKSSAYFVPDDNAPTLFAQPLSLLAGADTKLIKIDTDGFDFKIIKANLDYFSEQKPILFFESEFLAPQNHVEYIETFKGLFNAGYSYYIFWSARGNFVMEMNDLEGIKKLHNLLFRQEKLILTDSYDIAALHQEDKDVYDKVLNYFSNAKHLNREAFLAEISKTNP